MHGIYSWQSPVKYPTSYLSMMCISTEALVTIINCKYGLVTFTHGVLDIELIKSTN